MAASAPARDAEAMLAKVALECGGDISDSQEEVLATSAFLRGDSALAAYQDEEEEVVFVTLPDATQQQEDDAVTMCTLPFTPTPYMSDRSPKPPNSVHPHSPAPPISPNADAGDDVPLANPGRKPRVGTRKVSGARIRTPTPSSSPSPEQQQQPEQQPQAEQQQPQEELQHQTEQQQPVHVDPLVRAVLMIPTKTAANTEASTGNPVEDFLALCRLKGLI